MYIAGDVGKFEDFVVGDVVRPLYPEVTHVEGVKDSLPYTKVPRKQAL